LDRNDYQGQDSLEPTEESLNIVTLIRYTGRIIVSSFCYVQSISCLRKIMIVIGSYALTLKIGGSSG
jgi:hypothetical protein